MLNYQRVYIRVHPCSISEIPQGHLPSDLRRCLRSDTSKLEHAQDELVEKDTTGRELTISQGETQVIAMTGVWFGT